MSRGQAFRMALGGLLGLALLYLFLRGVPPAEIAAALRGADPVFLAGIVVSTLLGYAARAWRWGYLLSPLARVSFSQLFSITLIGFTAGLVIPRAGEVLRPYLVGRRHGVAATAAFASIILERLADLITVLALFGVSLFVLPAPAQQARGGVMDLVKAGGAVAALAALGVLAFLLLLQARAERALALSARLLRPLPRRLAAPLGRAAASFASGLGVLKSPPSHLAAILGQSLLVWLLIGLGIHWTNRAFGLALPFHATFVIIGFLTVGVAVPTPGMVGGFHEAYRLALTQVYGADAGVAVAAGIAAHALSNLPVLLLGMLCLGRAGLSVSRVAEMSERGGESAMAPAGGRP